MSLKMLLKTIPFMEKDVDTEALVINLMKKKKNVIENQNLGDIRRIPREGHTETIDPVVTTEETDPETLPGEIENYPEEDTEMIPEEELIEMTPEKEQTVFLEEVKETGTETKKDITAEGETMEAPTVIETDPTADDTEDMIRQEAHRTR